MQCDQPQEGAWGTQEQQCRSNLERLYWQQQEEDYHNQLQVGERVGCSSRARTWGSIG